MDNKEEPKHTFDLPSCILNLLLWTSRILVYTQLWNCDMSIINILLMIIFYFIVMECGICFICGLIIYIPSAIKDPAFFISNNIKDIIKNDTDFDNFTIGISTIAYLMIYFL